MSETRFSELEKVTNLTYISLLKLTKEVEKKQNNLSYTPESSANKVNTLFPINKETFPSTLAVSQALKKKVNTDFSLYPLASTPLTGTELLLIFQAGELKTIAASDIGGSSALEKRHEWVSPYSYCGTAPSGSLESANVWEIKRIEVLADGTTGIKSATGVAWDDRLTSTYI